MPRRYKAVFLGCLLVAITNPPMIYDDAMLIDRFVKMEGSNARGMRSHRNLLPEIPRCAFTRVTRGDQSEVLGRALQSPGYSQRAQTRRHRVCDQIQDRARRVSGESRQAVEGNSDSSPWPCGFADLKKDVG